MTSSNKIVEVMLSSDEEFEELRYGDGDESASITGYVESLKSPFRAGKKNDLLFKFMLSNGNKKVTVLIWGDKLIYHYLPEVTSFKIMRINGGYNQLISRTKCYQANVIPCEILIRENTTVSYFGYYQTKQNEITLVKEITFQQANEIHGLIKITGYVRTPFAAARSPSGLTYGLGAISDGTNKITVQIKNFTDIKMVVGDCVIVIGTILVEDEIVKIYCSDSSFIKSGPKGKMSEDEVQKGGRILRRKRSDQDGTPSKI